MAPEIILSALLSLTPSYTDRQEDQVGRRNRLSEVALAISTACGSNIELCAAEVILGDRETHYASLVQQNRCREMPAGQRCDGGRALGPWQLHRAACPKAWEAPLDLTIQARCVAGLLRWGKRSCGRWSGAFSYYALGRGECDWVGGGRRERQLFRILPILTGTELLVIDWTHAGAHKEAATGTGFHQGIFGGPWLSSDNSGDWG